MIIRAKSSTLKQGRWYEYVVRFALGEVATVVAGLVADIWGPAAGTAAPIRISRRGVSSFVPTKD